MYQLIKEESIKLHCTHNSKSVHCQFCEIVFKGTAFVWTVGTKWGKLFRKQSSSLRNGSRNHFPDWQSKTELIDFKDHTYIYPPLPNYSGLLHYVFIPRVKQWIKNSTWLFHYICEKSMQKIWVEVWKKCIWFIHDSASVCPWPS
jgi:hypothetical protein